MMQGRTRNEHEKEINEGKLEPINQSIKYYPIQRPWDISFVVYLFHFLRQALWPLLDSISNHTVRKARTECLLSTGFLWLFLWVTNGGSQELLCLRVSASARPPQNFPTLSVDNGSNDDYKLI